MSRRASLESRLKIMNSSMRFMNSGAKEAVTTSRTLCLTEGEMAASASMLPSSIRTFAPRLEVNTWERLADGLDQGLRKG